MADRRRATGGSGARGRWSRGRRGSAATQLAEGVWRVPTAPADFINSYLFADPDGRYTLVDTGLRSAPPKIMVALVELGVAPERVSRILLTHAHSDHSGGAAGLAGRTGAAVAAHAHDADDIESGTAPPLDPATRLGRLLRRGIPSDPVPVEQRLQDGDVLDVGGGLRVVHTPGHTPGHISLLHVSTGVLITGDAVWNMRYGLSWPVRPFCTSAAQNEVSAQRLLATDFDTVAFTHGPPISTGARGALESFLDNPRRFPGLW